MNMLSIITKKKNKEVLSKEEIAYAFQGYLEGNVPDYQMSALLMAICLQGMTDEETFYLTDLFLKSGDTLDLSMIDLPKVDKHSTGGIGDKTTMIIGPIVSCLGVVVPKMSGRGLGITGGTIDKLESIPGFRTDLTEEEFVNLLKKNGFAVTAQTKDLVPMDKKVYALRDVTGTTESIPLICSSILSKKFAGGADKILIDIKVGEGALLKNYQDGAILASLMQKIGSFYNKEVRTLLTPMDTPLGMAIGNRLEVFEAMEVLQGKGDKTLTELCVQIASNMVSMGKNISYDEAKEQVLHVIASGEAYQKFLTFVKDQGGKIEDLVLSTNCVDVLSHEDGVITKISARRLGELALSLGAGKLKQEELIDFDAGIILHCHVGDRVSNGDKLFTLYAGPNKEIPKVLAEDYVVIQKQAN